MKRRGWALLVLLGLALGISSLALWSVVLAGLVASVALTSFAFLAYQETR